MKRLLVLLCVSLLTAVTVCGQESGNRIYGNNGYYQQRRPLQTNSGNLGSDYGRYAIEATVVTNLKPDAFVVVFGVNGEALTSNESNDKVNQRISVFAGKLKPLGVNANDVYVDFITQNRVYDYSVTGTQAKENFTGFETKKTVAIRYKDRDQFEKIVSRAAETQIFDLIKVDYIVSDFEAVRGQLFDAAAKIIKHKEEQYVKTLGVQLWPIGLANEMYDVSYPSEAYQRYQAFETGDAYVYSPNNTSSKVMQRKSFTFFYEPFNASRFDAVLKPLGLEPAVQFSLYLRMHYDSKKPKDG